MENILLGLAFIIMHFTLVLLAYRFFGKTGLFVWIALATMLANIQVLKGIEIFTLQATLGNTLYGSIFLATDILSEKYGSRDAKKAVYVGFFSMLVFLFSMQGALLFTPLADPFAYDIQSAFELIFGLSARIVFASLVAYLVSQLLDVTIYSKIKEKLSDDRYLWVRNNGSTLISQLIDSVIFVTIAFVGLPYNLLQILITTYVLKLLIAIMDTPFIYLAKKIKNN